MSLLRSSVMSLAAKKHTWEEQMERGWECRTKIKNVGKVEGREEVKDMY